MSAEPVEAPAVPCMRRKGSVWSICTCPPCKARQSKLQKLNRLGMYRRTSAAVAWLALDDMIERGWSTDAIASATGVSFGTIRATLMERREGFRRNFQPTTARKIVQHGVPTSGFVPATGPMRKARALCRVGWTGDELAERYGLRRTSLGVLIMGRHPKVLAVLAVQIDRAYADLAGAVGPSWRAAQRAQKAGWAPPYAWGGVDLDDPTVALGEFPDADAPLEPAKVRAEKRRRSRAEVVRKRAKRAAATV